MDVSSSTNFTTQLRQERIRRNWRQQDLADELETTIATIKRWERGRQLPSAYFRVKLCALLDKSAEELGLVVVTPFTQEDVSQTEQEANLPAQSQALWTVPYLRNPHFTGREDVLD